MTDQELAVAIAKARAEFERLDAERQRRVSLAWAIKVLFG